MSWQKFDLIFRVLSPLHIGYLPNKAGNVISRTRYYVPGKNVWGAVTVRLTRKLFQNPVPEDYLKVGSWLKDNFRFSYLYLSNGEKIFIPKYREDQGLHFGKWTLHEFQQKFISSRISTMISKEGGSEDKTLHEIEFINNKYLDNNGQLKPLYLAGSVFFKKDTKFNSKSEIKLENTVLSLDEFNLFEVLTLGGELNYGFGRVGQTKTIERLTFNFEYDYRNNEIESEEPIIGHLKYNQSLQFRGDIEILSGRTYPTTRNALPENSFVGPGQEIAKGEYYFVPGTVIEPKGQRYILDSWGKLIISN